ncbi:MAG: serine/threonine protein kinase [Phycisphaerales bacterium]|nr:serine/threonine protein kinase [Phycisphaerales bacterium]
MDTDRFQRVCEIFEAARLLPEPDRDAFIAESCGDDQSLRDEVNELLEEHTRQSPLDSETPGVLAGMITQEHISETVELRERIGGYTIVRHIGEGGMGSVYEARQDNPDRLVALKVIKPGMDSEQVIARFETERQAVAKMDHPSIARIYNAGTTDDGRPFFVMELVRGVTIIEYAKKNSLNITDRLSLFVQVCRAVQHAHQRGIIHRDLKPSNVLVCEVDGEPVPKVIDFGIAKATEAELSTKAVMTLQGQLIGTPAYMSPEQAMLDGSHIDTRTDIYSLGVLLYELLTGTTPFTDQELLSRGVAEMMRVIQDQEPEKPSTRLSTLEKHEQTSSPEHESQRQTLSSMLKGDLDWIAMKCLEKDPERRYESSSSLANDIIRFRENEPIEARPPSKMYKTRKFVQRHRVQVIAGSIALGALVLGIAGTSMGLVWALDEQENAKYSERVAQQEARVAEETVEYLLTDLLGAADPARMEDRDLTVREAVMIASESIEGKFSDEPLLEARIRATIARTLDQLGAFGEAEPHHRRNLEIYRSLLGDGESEMINAIHSLASNLIYQSQFDEAIELTLEELEILRSQSVVDDERITNALSTLGEAYLQTGRYEKATPILEEALQANRELLGDLDPKTLSSMHNLAGLYGSIGNAERALELAQQAYEGRLEVLGPGDPKTFGSLNVVTWVLNILDRSDESALILKDAIDQAKERLGDTHLQTIALTRSLAFQYHNQGEYALAEQTLAPMVDTLRSTLGDQNLNTFAAMRTLGAYISFQGREEEALPLFTQALELARGTYPPDSLDLAIFMDSYGSSLSRSGRYAEAEPVFLEAMGILDHAGTAGDKYRTRIIESMIDLYTDWNAEDPDAALEAKLEALLE